MKFEPRVYFLGSRRPAPVRQWRSGLSGPKPCTKLAILFHNHLWESFWELLGRFGLKWTIFALKCRLWELSGSSWARSGPKWTILA